VVQSNGPWPTATDGSNAHPHASTQRGLRRRRLVAERRCSRLL